MNDHNVIPVSLDEFKQLKLNFVPSYNALWVSMDQKGIIPSYNMDLMNELHKHNLFLENTHGHYQIKGETHEIMFSIYSSTNPEIFSMGGDLVSMHRWITNKDKASLTEYAKRSIDVVYNRHHNHNLKRLFTISLCRGITIGAGIEASLASDYVIVEEESEFSFPEKLFNLFPAMGAYSLISRKSSQYIADRMIDSARNYSAQEMYEMGLVDKVVPKGEGEREVYNFIKKNKTRTYDAILSTSKAKKFVNPLRYEELESIVNLWVESALNLSDKNLSVMERFVRTQRKNFNIPEETTNNVVTLKRA